MKQVKRFCVALCFASTSAFAQVPHVTQPFSYLWDYPSNNLNPSSGLVQVQHFELQIDAALPVDIPGPDLTFPPSATTGFTTFKLLGSSALPTGPHTFKVIACPTATPSTAAASGCAASSPFAFVLDAPAPLPLPPAQRLGVGV